MKQERDALLTASHIFQEIHQQPAALARFLEKELDNVRGLAAAIEARNVTHVIIAARGTSDNAGRYAKYVLRAHNGLVVALSTPYGIWSVIGPVLMTFLLMRVSGVPLLERSIHERRPDYAEYAKRTSAFFPRPPR